MEQHGFRGRIGHRGHGWQGRVARWGATMACAWVPLAACDDEGDKGDATDTEVTDATDASDSVEDIDTQVADTTDISVDDTADTQVADTDAADTDTQVADTDAVDTDTNDTVEDTSDTDVTPTPFELEGVWKSEFGEEIITTDTWTGFCVDAIRVRDEVANVAILETLSGDGCLVGSFSRVTWKDIADDAFDYCTTAYGKTSADEAANAPTSGFDADDLAKGCGGFPWSHLTRD